MIPFAYPKKQVGQLKQRRVTVAPVVGTVEPKISDQSLMEPFGVPPFVVQVQSGPTALDSTGRNLRIHLKPLNGPFHQFNSRL